MPNGALFIGWGDPITGRETASLDMFREAKEFYDGLRKKGEIAEVEPVLLAHVGGPLRGFFLLHGDPAKLAALTIREDFLKLTAKASLVCKDLTIAPAYTDEAVPRVFEMYRTAINTLALQHQHV